MFAHSDMSRPRISVASESSSHPLTPTPLTPCTYHPLHTAHHSSRVPALGGSSSSSSSNRMSHTLTRSATHHENSSDHLDQSIRPVPRDRPEQSTHSCSCAHHTHVRWSRHSRSNSPDTRKSVLHRTSYLSVENKAGAQSYNARLGQAGVGHAAIMAGWARPTLQNDSHTTRGNRDVANRRSACGSHADIDGKITTATSPENQCRPTAMKPRANATNAATSGGEDARCTRQTISCSAMCWSRENGDALYRCTARFSRAGRVESVGYSLLRSSDRVNEQAENDNKIGATDGNRSKDSLINSGGAGSGSMGRGREGSARYGSSSSSSCSNLDAHTGYKLQSSPSISYSMLHSKSPLSAPHASPSHSRKSYVERARVHRQCPVHKVQHAASHSEHHRQRTDVLSPVLSATLWNGNVPDIIYPHEVVRHMAPILMHYLVLHRWRTVPHGNDYRVQRRPCYASSGDTCNSNRERYSSLETCTTAMDATDTSTAAATVTHRRARIEPTSSAAVNSGEVAAQGQTVWWLHNARPPGQFVFLVTPVMPPPAPQQQRTATAMSRNSAELPCRTGWGKGILSYVSSLVCRMCESTHSHARSVVPAPQTNSSYNENGCEEQQQQRQRQPVEQKEVRHDHAQKLRRRREYDDDNDKRDQLPAQSAVPKQCTDSTLHKSKDETERSALSCAPAFVNGVSDTRFGFGFFCSPLSRLYSTARNYNEAANTGASQPSARVPCPVVSSSSSAPAPPSSVPLYQSSKGDVCSRRRLAAPRSADVQCMYTPHDRSAYVHSHHGSNYHCNIKSCRHPLGSGHALCRHGGSSSSSSSSTDSSFCYRVSSRTSSEVRDEAVHGDTQNVCCYPKEKQYPVHNNNSKTSDMDSSEVCAGAFTYRANTIHDSNQKNKKAKRSTNIDHGSNGEGDARGHQSARGVEAVVILHKDTTGLDFQTGLMTSRWSMEVRVVRTYYFASMADVLTYFGCPTANTDIDSHVLIPCCCCRCHIRTTTYTNKNRSEGEKAGFVPSRYSTSRTMSDDGHRNDDFVGGGGGRIDGKIHSGLHDFGDDDPYVYRRRCPYTSNPTDPLPHHVTPQLVSTHTDTIVSVYSADPGLTAVLRELLLRSFGPGTSLSPSLAPTCATFGRARARSSSLSASSLACMSTCHTMNARTHTAATTRQAEVAAAAAASTAASFSGYTRSESEQRRLLALYETGLPYWALMLATTRLPYRHHLRITVMLLSNIWPFLSLFVGFYDLYRHMPQVKRILRYLVDPTARWVERHVTVRVSVLCTYVLSVWFSIVTNLHVLCPPFSLLHHWTFLPLLQLLWSLLLLPVQLLLDTANTFMDLVYVVSQLGWWVAEWVGAYTRAAGLLCVQTSLIQTCATTVRDSSLVSFFWCTWLGWQEFYTTVAAPVKNALSAVVDLIHHVVRSLWRHENTIRSSIASWRVRVTLMLSIWREWIRNWVHGGPTLTAMVVQAQQQSMNVHNAHHHPRTLLAYRNRPCYCYNSAGGMLSRRRRHAWALVRWIAVAVCVISFVCMWLGLTSRTWAELKHLSMTLVKLVEGLPWRGTGMNIPSLDVI